MNLRCKIAVMAALSPVVLAGCSTGPASPVTATQVSAAPDDHGRIDGAVEVAEAPLHLVAIDGAGHTSVLDLVDGSEASLGHVEPAEDISTDGRYVFAANSSGVEIIDSGVWTWDHVDHFHYYRSDPRVLGRLSGDGVAAISTGLLSTAGATGVFFPASGDAVLLDNAALAKGEIVESLHLSVHPHDGLIAPLGSGAVVSESDGGVGAARLRVVDVTGRQRDAIECEAASETMTTRAGLVIGCADGAVIATWDGESPVLHHVRYPDGTSVAPASSFDARKGRPTIAGIGEGQGIWILDTRERGWKWVATTTPVIAAVAVDDADGHLVAVGQDGTVQVYDAESGAQLAVTEPLLDKTLANADLADNLTLTVDAQRAYVNAPGEGVVYEIDYADGARIARTLQMSVQPVHLAETGR